MENQFNGTPKATFYLNELSGELAELFIQMKYEGQNVSLYNIKDEDDDMRYTDKIQDEYNYILERIEDYLQSTKL
jgi:disulfide oxidoreductase YuzD